ncbi:hypothetical protein [Methylobacterium sp. J-067]|uniref:hypothetical protein n=1 Tax=Methylobacterium sp. J-067 TaxID=2836648 RepID=UPI001FB9B8D8|nr:hypothetical protein [Methylobacterium sp. J-067]MCJ2025176.1 hypothetical protein [Methylobacterium sp. J-067]
MSFGETFAAFGSLGDAYRQGKQRDALAALGAPIQAGDYAGAAKAAFEAGDPGTGIGLLKLGQAAQLEARKQAFAQDFSSGLGAIMGGGGGGDTGVPLPVSDAGRSVPSFLDSSSPSSGYVAGLFKRESNNNDFAQAPTSSARGAGQFTRGTWNRLASQSPDLNLTPVGNGQDGRTDRAQMVQATNALTAQNEGVLQGSGLPVTDASRYALHFLGAGGGRRLVAGVMRNPDAPAASYADAAQVAANRNVFFNRDGSPKSGAQVMADFGRSFGGGGASTVRQAQAAPAPGPVAYADDEAGVQALEQRMGMTPPASRQVASADPQADLPAEGAQEAAFYVPPAGTVASPAPGLSGSGQASGRPVPVLSLPSSSSNAPAPVGTFGGRTMTMPGEGGAPPQVAAAQAPQDATVARQPVGAIQASPLGQRIPFLMRALASPYIEGGQKELASTLLRQALDEAKMPDTVKEFMWARAHGMTQATSPNAYALEKQRNPGADLQAQIRTREQEGIRLGMQPGSPELQNYALGYKPTIEKDEGAKVTAQIEARRAQAPSLGLEEGTPAYRSFVGTGKLGADRDMSAADKKAIDTADNAVISAQSSIHMLEQAKELSKDAYGGPFASERGKFMSTFGGERGQATQELDNLVTTNALTNLKSIFGGNPTEGERKILLDVAGSSNLPHELRVKVYQRAIDAAQLRMQQNADRAAQIREGTYYRPGSGPGRGADAGGGDGGRQPAARQGAQSSQGAPADRFGQLIGSGMTKAQAYEQMHREGY